MSPATPGRRVRVEPRRRRNDRSSRRPALAVGAVVVAVLLLAVAGARSSHRPAGPSAGRGALVTSTVMSCSPLTDGKQPAGDQTYAAASQVVDPSSATTGARSARVLPGTGALPALQGSRPGQWRTATRSAVGRSSLLLDATGAMAPGATAFTAATAGKRLGGGLTVSSCTRPVRDEWFVGAGSSAQHQTALTMTNTTSAPAVVDVSLLGAKGTVEAVGGSGIVIAPYAVRVVRIEDLAAGEDELTVHTVVQRGAASVSAVDVWSSGTSPSGTEWLPASHAPTRTPVVTGIARADSRTLLVTNPGDRTATATVTVAGSDGRFTPTGLAKVQVPPHAITSVKIPASVESKAYALALDADEPVTAAVRLRTTGAASDTAYAVADRPLGSTAVLPLDLPGTKAEPTLMLTNARTDAAVSVTVSAFDAAGTERGRTTVSVPAGRTVSFDPSARGTFDVAAAKIAYLGIDPGSARVLATASYRAGVALSVLPLGSAPRRSSAPAVQPAP